MQLWFTQEQPLPNDAEGNQVSHTTIEMYLTKAIFG